MGQREKQTGLDEVKSLLECAESHLNTVWKRDSEGNKDITDSLWLIRLLIEMAEDDIESARHALEDYRGQKTDVLLSGRELYEILERRLLGRGESSRSRRGRRNDQNLSSETVAYPLSCPRCL